MEIDLEEGQRLYKELLARAQSPSRCPTCGKPLTVLIPVLQVPTRGPVSGRLYGVGELFSSEDAGLCVCPPREETAE